MKENTYDDDKFFEQYCHMQRSVLGLRGAGEWHTLKQILPDFSGKRALDLGCGFGWHCQYAIENGATMVTGIDISEKMLEVAGKICSAPNIEYRRMAIEDFEFTPQSYDIVISSLTFHYLESFDDICRKVYRCLDSKGVFVFSVEHPVFTAQGTQDWYYNQEQERMHWPVDQYFIEGRRTATFLGESVTKYHKTLTTYINSLLGAGFSIQELIEPQPSQEHLLSIPEMKDELRRPMMLIIAAEK